MNLNLIYLSNGPGALESNNEKKGKSEKGGGVTNHVVVCGCEERHRSDGWQKPQKYLEYCHVKSAPIGWMAVGVS